ncbi:MAG: DUF4878 domain-containing protein [Bacteroidales bacterium]|jgi:hypothetical protein|nr:DUF4878 domain-containing protein [Bacteroidales bacterium]MBP5240961.1 DUF4878 domain-containing protein [Bacteroidales bacterium]
MKKVFRIMAIAVLGVAMATSCAKSDEDQVKQAANDFLTAFNKLDFDGAKKYATPESAEQIDAYASLAAMGGATEAPKFDVEITKVEINGEDATANYTLKAEGKDAEESALKLKKVDGKWLAVYTKEGFGGGEAAETEEGETTEEATDQPTEEEMAQAEANIPE